MMAGRCYARARRGLGCLPGGVPCAALASISPLQLLPTAASRPAPAPAAPLAPLPYLAGLNNLRAIAALAVCLFHFLAGTLPVRELVPAAKAVFEYGSLGVPVFFVLSGFIIPYSLLGQHYQLRQLRGYLWRRAVRLVPPAYVAMLLTVAQWALADRLTHTSFYLSRLSWGQVLHNVLFTVPFAGGEERWIVGVCWTLATEFQFYLFLGLLFPVLFQRSGWAFVAIYVAAGLPSLLAPLSQATFFSYSPLFALGGATLLWQQKQLSSLAYAGCLALFAGLASYYLTGLTALVGLGTVLGIVTLTRPLAGLSYVGRISYSLYLLHVLVGTVVEFGLVHLISPSTAGRRLFIVGLCTAAALVGAAVFYRWVERPFMQLAARKR